jgi:predicted dehydrogenase
VTGDVGTYSVGILGCGEIVSNMHLPTLLATSGVHVAWVTDVDVRKAERVAAAFGVRALGVPAAPTALPPADIVLIAIPYGVREPYYEQLRHRRNALYVEKPLARTVEEHRRYCAWFEHTQLAVGFQRRAWGAVETMQRVLRATPFGPVQKVRVEYGRPGQLTGSRYSSDLRLAGGGMLFEVGVHWIDLALTATGATGARLVGGRMIRQDGFDLHTDAVFTLERGQLEDVPFELLISGLVETRNAIEVHCEHATLRFSLGGGRLLSIERAGVPLDVELVGTPTPSPSTVFQLCHAMWRGLIESVSTGAPNWTSASSSLVTTEVIEAAYGLPS